MPEQPTTKGAKDSKEGETPKVKSQVPKKKDGRKEAQKVANGKKKILATRGTQVTKGQAAEFALFCGFCASCG
jgi:hypothetical protein